MKKPAAESRKATLQSPSLASHTQSPSPPQRSPKSAKGGGGAGSKKSAAGSRKAKPVTDWASVKWGELGATKDGRFVLPRGAPVNLLYPLNCMRTTTSNPYRDWNLKLCTWNVNGIRAWLKVGINCCCGMCWVVDQWFCRTVA